jgi:penicillin-binding protein 1C
MQTARLIDPHSRTFSGKFKQIFRALQLEWHFSKTDILNIYLELAPFGGNLQGVEAASRAYFDKFPIELSHAEAALLAVLPQSPSRFRPDRFPQKAAKARDKVVHRMVDNQVWEPSILEDVVMESVYAREPVSPIIAPLLSRRVLKTPELSNASTISTSVDLELQLALQTRLKDFAYLLPKGTTASAVIVENKNWLVKAYVGSAFFADEVTHGYVDMVTAVRSPGSTLKPFIYGLAMDESLIHSESLLVDAPRWRSDYQPENFTHSFSGAVSATTALQASLNLPAVQVLEKLTPKLFTSRLQNVGIRPIIPSGRSNLAMALGGFGISMEELLNLYGALARDGKVAKLRVSENQPLNERPLLSPQAAWIVFNMLSSQQRPDRPFESAQTGFKNNLAFKTGTSYGYRDAWAFGVSGKYTLGVWVGRPDGTPSPGQYGAITALPLLFQVSDWLADSTMPKRPYKVSEADICWPSGVEKTSMLNSQCLVTRKALGIDGQFPATIAASADDSWLGSAISLQVAEDSGLRVEPNCGVDTITKQITVWP